MSNHFKPQVLHVRWPEAAAPPNLSADEAHIWAVSIDEHGAPNDKLSSTLSNDERHRAEQFQLDAPRRRFIAARAALRRLLGHYLGVPAAEVPIAYQGNGKPRLDEAAGSGTLRFNLAHTNDLALVVVTHGCDVGVDMEIVRTVRHLESIARRYFHPAEVNEILTASIESRHEAFLRCWTAKEAVVKAIGTGLTDSLAAFRVPVTNAGSTWVEVPIHINADPQRCWLEQLTPCQGAIAAVAFVGEKRRVRCFTLSISV